MLHSVIEARAWPSDQPIVLQDIQTRRGGRDILRGINLVFPPGSRTAIVGPSGSGKSSLLRLLNRLNDPSEGQILVGEIPITLFPVTMLRREVGMVFQAPRPLPGTVSDVLSYPNSLVGQPAPANRAEALEEVGLDPSWLDRDTSGLSGGERQRLAIAVALQTDPSVLCLDEPTSALDPTSANRVADILQARSRRDGLTIIAVTHNRDHARRLGDRVVVLDAGRVVDEGPAGEVLERADHANWVPVGEPQ